MLLSAEDAREFFQLHFELACFANRKLQIIPGTDTPEGISQLPVEARVKLRSAMQAEPQLLTAFINENPFELAADQLGIIDSWHDGLAGRFCVVRHLKAHSIFLTMQAEPVAYGVLGIMLSLESMIGAKLPVVVDATLLPFKGRIVYDSFIIKEEEDFTANQRAAVLEIYKYANERGGIVTSLPGVRTDVAPKRVSKSKRPKSTALGSGAPGKLEQITELIKQFCQLHLNEEYAEVCGQLAEKLARKRPSPLLTGEPRVWTCGIVRTIGMVNFLSDPSRTPHLKLSVIDEHFGVGKTTGQNKSLQIRKMLKIHQLDPQWTLPSLLGDNPMVWMLELDGFIVDIRDCEREMQEAAFEQGLIPYVPLDVADPR